MFVMCSLYTTPYMKPLGKTCTLLAQTTGVVMLGSTLPERVFRNATPTTSTASAGCVPEIGPHDTDLEHTSAARTILETIGLVFC